jgi:hypothetical protein
MPNAAENGSVNDLGFSSVSLEPDGSRLFVLKLWGDRNGPFSNAHTTPKDANASGAVSRYPKVRFAP